MEAVEAMDWKGARSGVVEDKSDVGVLVAAKKRAVALLDHPNTGIPSVAPVTNSVGALWLPRDSPGRGEHRGG
jgi:hypothetical protein